MRSPSPPPINWEFIDADDDEALLIVDDGVIGCSRGNESIRGVCGCRVDDDGVHGLIDCWCNGSVF